MGLYNPSLTRKYLLRLPIDDQSVLNTTYSHLIEFYFILFDVKTAQSCSYRNRKLHDMLLCRVQAQILHQPMRGQGWGSLTNQRFGVRGPGGCKLLFDLASDISLVISISLYSQLAFS